MKNISAAPCLHDRHHTFHYPLVFLLALAPALIQGVVINGLLSLIPLGIATTTSLAVAWLASKLRKQAFSDWPHALLAGVFLAALMPANAPWYVPLTAAVAGLGLGYLLLGASRTAWLNPPALGTLMATLAWPQAFLPGDGSASYLGRWLDHLILHPGAGIRPSEQIASFVPSHAAGPGSIVHQALAGLGALNVPAELVDMFLGLVQGPVGTVSAVLLLAGSVLLFATRIADWRTSAGAFVSFAPLTLLFGGLATGGAFARGDVLFFIASGSFLFIVLFLANWYSTLPLSSRGRFHYGLVLGGLLFIAGHFGSGDAALLVALLGANMMAPFIDRMSRSSTRHREAHA